MKRDEEYAYLLILHGDELKHHINTIIEMDRYITDHSCPATFETKHETSFMAAYDFVMKHKIVNQNLYLCLSKPTGDDVFSILVWHKVMRGKV